MAVADLGALERVRRRPRQRGLEPHERPGDVHQHPARGAFGLSMPLDVEKLDRKVAAPAPAADAREPRVDDGQLIAV